MKNRQCCNTPAGKSRHARDCRNYQEQVRPAQSCTCSVHIRNCACASQDHTAPCLNERHRNRIQDPLQYGVAPGPRLVTTVRTKDGWVRYESEDERGSECERCGEMTENIQCWSKEYWICPRCYGWHAGWEQHHRDLAVFQSIQHPKRMR